MSRVVEDNEEERRNEREKQQFELIENNTYSKEHRVLIY